MSLDLLGISAIGRWIGRGAFIGALEKHLDDYRRGRGYLSGATASAINRQHLSNAALPAPDLSLYSQYSSGLSYTSQAYFANAVYGARLTVESIQSAPENAQNATNDLKRTLGYA